MKSNVLPAVSAAALVLLATTMLSTALLPATTCRAAVDQVAPNGFLVKHEVAIAAPPAEVWDALVEKVGQWWSPAHTWSGDAANLSIDARPGGCFCESLPYGGGVEHLRVVYVAPRRMLRMAGALGPLQSSGLTGHLTITLTEDGAGTKVALAYSVGGFLEYGFDAMAPAVDGVLVEQMERLAAFVETGAPTQATAGESAGESSGEPSGGSSGDSRRQPSDDGDSSGDGDG
jgi:uncharacterized protein YndB with AHSA1/START domain